MKVGQAKGRMSSLKMSARGLTPTGAGPSQELMRLGVPEEHLEAFPFSKLRRSRVELLRGVLLVGHGPVRCRVLPGRLVFHRIGSAVAATGKTSLSTGSAWVGLVRGLRPSSCARRRRRSGFDPGATASQHVFRKTKM